MVTSYRLPVAGWLLVAGCWLLVGEARSLSSGRATRSRMDFSQAESLLATAERLRSQLRGAVAKGTIEEFETHRPEFAAAIDAFGAARQATHALRLANALTPIWMAAKQLEAGLTLLQHALELPGGDNDHRGRALFNVGYLQFWKGDYDESFASQTEAVAFGRRTGEPTVTALALVGLARIALRNDVEE